MNTSVLSSENAVARRAQTIVQAAAALLLAVGYLLYIRRYGVNLPFWDEWALGEYVLRRADGRLSLGELLAAKHNEHLVGASFALMLLVHAATGYDSKAILYVSAALQFASLGLLLLLARPLLPPPPRRGWHALLLATVLLSVAPSWNILWGFQTAWYLVTFFLLASLWLLDRALHDDRRSAAWLAAAAVAAALASFSSIHGLAAWLAGAVFLAAQRADDWRALVEAKPMRLWLAAGAAFLVLFAWVYSLTPTVHSTPNDLIDAVSAGPAALAGFALRLFSTAWGDHLGRVAPLAGGVVAVLAAAGVLVALRPVNRRRMAMPLAVMAFALSFVLMVAVGRYRFGMHAALEARYSAYVLLAVAAAFLMLMGASEGLRGQRMIALGRGALVVLLLAMFASATVISLKTARGWRVDRGIGAMVLLNFDREPDLKIVRTIHFDPGLVRRQAQQLRERSLSTFADGPDAIPPQSAFYAKPPASLVDLARQRPGDGAALQRLWHLYVTSGDVRRAFPMYAPSFPADLIGWAAQSARGRHHLSPYLAEFAERYERLRDDLAAREAPRSR